MVTHKGFIRTLKRYNIYWLNVWLWEWKGFTLFARHGNKGCDYILSKSTKKYKGIWKTAKSSHILKFIFTTTEDLSDAYKRLKRLIMEYLGMSPPSTVHSELFSGSMTSVDTSQSEDTLHQGNKSGTSQTTSATVNMAARTWSRRSDSSTIPPKGVKLTQQKTPVVNVFLMEILDSNRKANFSVFGALSSIPMSRKALVLALTKSR